ncbi:F-box family protein [Trifolium medium]|uniref:F-box family protein n=1 Tax=Trifolium medium TaxID=97028 RepID=A0A392NB66_9FABA|nr:F-box family protein [Trifolium medium]
MGNSDGNVWRWEFQWRRNCFVWEEPMMMEFMELLNQFVPSVCRDKWLWRVNRDQGFTVNECYVLLQQKYGVLSVLDPVAEFAFTNLWKCGAPSKVCAFSWQLLLDRIQTKDNLFKRGILQYQQTNCALCELAVESSVHLFLHCDCSSKVWYDIMRWLGLVVIIPSNLASSFGLLVGCGKNKRSRECLALIWNSLLWTIWKVRNDFVFNNKEVVIEEMVDQVKTQSWKWFIGRKTNSPCLLYEWKWSPFDCFQR